MSLEENLQLRRAGQDCVGLDGVERNERISRSYHVCLVLSSLPSDGPFGFGSIWLTYQYVSVSVPRALIYIYTYIIHILNKYIYIHITHI